MGKLTKNQKLAAAKIDTAKSYSLTEAVDLLKEITFTKFDASVDIDVRLGVDPRKANQMLVLMLLVTKCLNLCLTLTQQMNNLIAQSFIVLLVLVLQQQTISNQNKI